MSYGSTLSEQSILFIRSRESLWHLARPWRVNISTSRHGKGRNPNEKKMSESSDGYMQVSTGGSSSASMGKKKREWVPVLFGESQRSLRLKTKTSLPMLSSSRLSKRMLTCSWLQNIFKECFHSVLSTVVTLISLGNFEKCTFSGPEQRNQPNQNSGGRVHNSVF